MNGYEFHHLDFPLKRIENVRRPIDRIGISFGVILAASLILALHVSTAPAGDDSATSFGLQRSAESGSAIEPPLPPEPAWSGASEALLVGKDDPWVTPAELTDLTDSPSYSETMAWLHRLVAAAPQLQMLSIGTSPEGRELWLVVASQEGARSPAELRANGRPTLFAQAGIHSGEIDGKDAGMMLLRDMTVAGSKTRLLDGANFLFLPIFSVDGHERASPWGRINQRGPLRQGWRTNARNLNLNRDYAKLDTPEMQAVVAFLEKWPVDLYLDIHVTDGADYQYDITFGWNGPHRYSPSSATWLERALRPALDHALAAQGHVPGPLVFPVDAQDLAQGNRVWTASPRYSNGYGDVRHLPTVLVENHSLKSFRRRVLGTYVLLESCLKVLAEQGDSLRAAVDADKARRRDPVPLAWKAPGDTQHRMEFKAIRAERALSEISGSRYVRWTGQAVALEIPVISANEVSESVSRPTAYWLPPAWPQVIERLRLHGIQMEKISVPRDIEVEMYRLKNAVLATTAYEGHVRVEQTTPTIEKRHVTFPAGSVRVPTNQALGDLAILLLEPRSTDSFYQWGFFLEVLSRTEYGEAYVVEPLARKMLAADPELRREFRQRLAADNEFRGSPRERLDFFYRRTRYYDDRYLLYPVAREVTHWTKTEHCTQ